MGFTDTHAHLHFPDYGPDQEEVIARARASGVEFFINIGTDYKSSVKSLELAKRHDFIWAAAGIHPNDCKDADSLEITKIRELSKEPRVVAIGEVGLDYYRNHSPKEKQLEILREFLKIHKEIHKPLVIHCRDAYEALLEVFREEKPESGVMHCFSSDRPIMEKFLEMGFYISFAGPLTYKKNDALREACKNCPIDRLLLETDAPFLPPQSVRGKRNEPSYLLETARAAAELHGLSLETLGEKTTQNARRLFSL